jgi:hypothetical protein
MPKSGFRVKMGMHRKVQGELLARRKLKGEIEKVYKYQFEKKKQHPHSKCQDLE